jgi:hypothetical protein
VLWIADQAADMAISTRMTLSGLWPFDGPSPNNTPQKLC